MSTVRRIYVEKKPGFHIEAQELEREISHYLGIHSVKEIRILNRYDVENISDETFARACSTVFSEPPVDDLFHDDFPKNAGNRIFSVEFLPGQFDQRADSAVQCIQFINENEQAIIRCAKTYVVIGKVVLMSNAIDVTSITAISSTQRTKPPVEPNILKGKLTPLLVKEKCEVALILG